MHTLKIFFDWPLGSVWSNMIAWVICGGLAGLWSVRKFIKWNHKREEKDEERHILHMKKLDDMHQDQRQHHVTVIKHLTKEK